MNLLRVFVISTVSIAIIIAGGFFAYGYLVQHPPTFLAEWIAPHEPPVPLPEGDRAPFAVPEGFAAFIYSRETPGARAMVRDPKGTILASLTSGGKIVAIPDFDADGKADKTLVVLENLKEPHGLLVSCPETGNASADQDTCILYVAETDALKSYAYDADTFTAKYRKTLAAFPSGSGHYTRSLLMHPDGKRLLASIGSSCNVCDEKDPRRATIQAIDLETGRMSLFAKGLRNTVFMAVHPTTGEVWGTDHGRDLIGDDIPPDEVNIIVEGKDYGWPLCYGKNVHDTNFDKKKQAADPCRDKEPSHIDIQAHSAVLGLAFVPRDGWPQEMRNDVLVALHGSWNRSVPTGYKVIRIDLDEDGKPQNGGAPSDFMTGFLAAGSKASEAKGRPVGLLADANGTLYVSDDRAGAIYRIVPLTAAQ